MSTAAPVALTNFFCSGISLASPGQCQVNLLQKKKTKHKHKEATALGALTLNLHQRTATQALPHGRPTAALPTDHHQQIHSHTKKNKKKLYHPPRSRTESRPPPSPAEPGRAAGAGSALIVLLYDKERPPPHRHLPVCSPTPSECQVPVTRVRS